MITKGDGEALAKTVLAADHDDRCPAVAANAENWHVVAHRGRFFQYQIEDMGLDGDDLSVSPPPDRPGIYVFEVSKVVGRGWNPERRRREEYFVFGDWRAAGIVDFDALDLGARLVGPPARMMSDARDAAALGEVFETLVRVVYDNESSVFPVVPPSEPLMGAARQ